MRTELPRSLDAPKEPITMTILAFHQVWGLHIASLEVGQTNTPSLHLLVVTFGQLREYTECLWFKFQEANDELLEVMMQSFHFDIRV